MRGIVHTVKKLGHIIRQGITPGGKRKQNAEQETLGAERIEACLGVYLFAAANVADEVTGKLKKQPLKRRACKMCAINTPTFCTGCNRYLCVDKDRIDTLCKI